MNKEGDHRMSEQTSQMTTLPSEVVAFCQLLARILYRCLQEQDERLLDRLGLPIAILPIEVESQCASQEHHSVILPILEQDPTSAKSLPGESKALQGSRLAQPRNVKREGQKEDHCG
jgi:hypothetical protein